MQRAKPFIKWAGGKTRLLEQIDALLPRELKNGSIRNYAEPFLGSGAVYFYISTNYKIQNAYLSDCNRDLILTYQVIQQKSGSLSEILFQYQKKYNNIAGEKRYELFYDVRKQFNEERTEINYLKFSDNWVRRAAQFIFLNKTCYNGLFRLNAQGEFNVPFGRYIQAAIFDEQTINTVSATLRNAELVCADYSLCYSHINKNTFVYFDPPYRPLTQTSRFTAYTGSEFNDARQLELAHFFRKLDNKKNAQLMLSNSDPANNDPDDTFFEDAYSGYTISRVSAGRAINCNRLKRGRINELVIRNYQD